LQVRVSSFFIALQKPEFGTAVGGKVESWSLLQDTQTPIRVAEKAGGLASDSASNHFLEVTYIRTMEVKGDRQSESVKTE
jgi:hypothetical protein